jgi:hypothetical protein
LFLILRSHSSPVGILGCLFFLSEDEGSASLDGRASSDLAFSAFKLKSSFLCELSLLAEDGFGLASETLLLSLITASTLSELGSFTGFVLSYLERFVDFASDAISVFHLGAMDL